MARILNGRYLAQFTDRATYEIEVDARDELEALEMAAALHRLSSPNLFSLVERDVTDWIAVPLGSLCMVSRHRDDASDDDAEYTRSPPSRLPMARMMQSHEIQEIIEFLDELSDTTLNRSTFERTNRMLRLIRPR